MTQEVEKHQKLKSQYKKLVAEKVLFLITIAILTVLLSVYAISSGSSDLSFSDVLKAFWEKVMKEQFL